MPHPDEKVYFLFENEADQNLMLWTSEQVLEVEIKESWLYYIGQIGLKMLGSEQPQMEFRVLRWANMLAWEFHPVGGVSITLCREK